MGHDIKEIVRLVVGLKDLMDGMSYADEGRRTVSNLLDAYLKKIRQDVPCEFARFPVDPGV